MNTLFRTPLKFGLMGTGVIILMFFVYQFTGSNPLIEMRIFDFFIIPIFLFFGIKDFRDADNSGLMEFWQGMTAGFIIYGCIAVIYSAFLWLAVSLISPNMLEEYIAQSLKVLNENSEKLIGQMGQENFDTSYLDVGKTTTFDLVLDSLVKKAGIGFFLTSLIATVLKKKEKPS